MRFYNFNDFHNYIRENMTELHTNIALIDIEEKNKEDTVNETYIVTRDLYNEELNFFAKSGIHMTWLSFDGEFPSSIESLDVKRIIDMAVCDISVIG